MKCPDATELAECLTIAAGHISLLHHRLSIGLALPTLPREDSRRIATALTGWYERQRLPGQAVPEGSKR